MPQLDKVTFLSQFFWLCVFYLGLYYVVLKHFLPKLSRILAVRKKKLNLSESGVSSLQQENTQIRGNTEHLLASALSTSKKLFQDFFTHTNSWLDTNAQTITKTHYQTVNNSYIEHLGETSLSQNILLYHASKNLPEKLMVKFLLEKMKNLKESPAFKAKARKIK